MKFNLLSFLMLPLLLGASPCKQIRVAVIDSGLDLKDSRFTNYLCKSGHKDFTGEGFKDFFVHGTHVAGLILQNAGDANYCLLIYKYYSIHASGKQNLSREISSIKYAIKNEATVVNFSGGGSEFSEEEYDLIRNNPQVTFVVAAGNEHQDLDVPGNEYYPASYGLTNIVLVGNLDKDNRKSPSSNWGSHVVWEIGSNVFSTLPNGREGYMSGTSMATAVRTGKLVDKLSKSCEYR